MHSSMLLEDSRSRAQRESLHATHKAARLVQHIWEMYNPGFSRDEESYLRDFAAVQLRMDANNDGHIHIDEWLDLVQEVICRSSTDPVASKEEAFMNTHAGAGEEQTGEEPIVGWEPTVLNIWFAIDSREVGKLPGSRFVAWLRQLVEVSFTSMRASSQAYVTMQRGWSIMKGGSAMPKSYLNRLLAFSAALKVQDAEDKDASVAQLPREEELESIPTKWSMLTTNSHLRPTGHPDEQDSLILTGNPVVEPDGFKTIACLHFQTTVKEEDPLHGRRRCSPIEIIELACVLVNRNTGRIVDEFHSYIKPQYVQDFSRLSYAITLAQKSKIEAHDGFSAVWRRFETWLRLRNILDRNNQCFQENRTVFVVEADQLSSILPLQLRLIHQPMPVYLEDWVDLNVIFKRHFRCDECAGCQSRTSGACRANLLVPQMIMLLRSKHWDEFTASLNQRKGDDNQALIDIMMYGIESDCFDSTSDQLYKETASVDDGHRQMHGYLYMLKACSQTQESDLISDSILDWQLRLFHANGWNLSFVQDDSSDLRCHVLKLGDIESIEPVRARAQQHAFEIKIVDRVKSTHNFVRLAADLASERERWIQGLLILASIRKEGGFAVQDLLLQGIKPELARKAPELLNFSASVSPPDHDRIKSLLESGYDEDLAKSVLDEEDEAIQDMQSTLARLGIDPGIASKCASTLSETFETYRTGFPLPAATGLQYCRDMGILIQALVTFGADFTCTNGLSWYHLDLKQNVFDSTLVESLDRIAEARRYTISTRGHATLTTSGPVASSARPLRKVRVEVPLSSKSETPIAKRTPS